VRAHKVDSGAFGRTRGHAARAFACAGGSGAQVRAVAYPVSRRAPRARPAFTAISAEARRRPWFALAQVNRGTPIAVRGLEPTRGRPATGSGGFVCFERARVWRPRVRHWRCSADQPTRSRLQTVPLRTRETRSSSFPSRGPTLRTAR
jgi:hypothetical protein